MGGGASRLAPLGLACAMSADRDAVLDGSNPEWERSGTHHYGDPGAEARAVDRDDVIAALTHLGVIEVWTKPWTNRSGAQDTWIWFFE